MNEEMVAGTTLFTFFASDGDSNDNVSYRFAVNESDFEINQGRNSYKCKRTNVTNLRR